jgi:hypothetical protein
MGGAQLGRYHHHHHQDAIINSLTISLRKTWNGGMPNEAFATFSAVPAR